MCLLISNVAIAHHTLRMSGMECGRCSSHAKVVVQSRGAKGGSTCVGGADRICQGRTKEFGQKTTHTKPS
jgi:hypothetical protein